MTHPDGEHDRPEPDGGGFKLTPRAAGLFGRRPAGGKSRRNLLLGASAVPFVTTIASQPVFAKNKKGGGSLAMSTGGKKKKKRFGSISTQRGDTVAVWQRNYPKLMQHHTVEASAFPAAIAGSQYLKNPSVASVFQVLEQSGNGVEFAVAEADLQAALHGRATWEISVTNNGETARRTMDGRYFAEAAAAVLNGAAYGENGFGLNDAMVIDLINRNLANMQSKAQVLAKTEADLSAEDILAQLVRHIEGGFETRGETYYLAQMNSRGMA